MVAAKQEVAACGAYYKLAVSLLCLTAMFGALPLYTNVYLTYTPGYQCLLNATNLRNKSWNTEINSANTSGEMKTVEADQKQCYFHNNSSNISSDTLGGNMIACESWRFLKSPEVESISTEFSLVCGNAWLSPLITSAQMLGFMVGSLAGGTLSDRLGRRPVFLTSILLEATSLLVVSLSSTLATVYVSMFVMGVGMIVRGVTGMVIINEIVPNRHRRAVGILAMVSESLSGTLVPLVALLLSDWRWISLASSVSLFVVSFPVFIFVYETLKWLHQTNNPGEIEKVLTKIGRINGEKPCVENQDTPEETNQLTTKDTSNQTKSYNYLDLVKVDFIRRRIIILSYAWFAADMAFYGLTFNANHLGGNRYINSFLTAVVEFPSHIICYLVVRKYGCRCSFIFSAIVTVICMVAVPLMQQGSTVHQSLPYVIMATVSLFAVVAMFFLPETKGLHLPETLEEARSQDRHRFQCTERRDNRNCVNNNTVANS
uniref:solute carrier family 22 member 2-like isoform X2 n=1 Tax=Ciona intestinalis TaxID=7719 RepID=UPI000EF48517|nr:solute carrier family 22 member 2-like isoform X2 [Ciona intestinalis]|eukprot:XP_026692059.1 solute carrier family 22 member 2-like isoform X2 [Ciona intestinalis]